MVKKRISPKISRLVNNYVERLSRENNIPIQRVVLFGSQVKGTQHEWSDIDICIVSPRFTHPFKTLQLLWRERNEEEVSAGLEPVGFTPEDFESGGSLIDEIKRTGVELR